MILLLSSLQQKEWRFEHILAILVWVLIQMASRYTLSRMDYGGVIYRRLVGDGVELACSWRCDVWREGGT
jgi:hypothetical protein